MMFRFIVALSLLVTYTFANCVPDQTGFYWAPKCQGQKFDNLITINDLTASQNGVSMADLKGLNLSVPIDLKMDITDNYGVIAKPLIDIEIYAYSGVLSCGWTKQPTFGMLNNLDGCTIIPPDQCHLDGDPKSITASIDLKKLMGSLESLVTVNDYYGLAVTVLDGSKSIACAWAQDVVISK